MKLFYIPDGHRRYAEANRLSMEEAYSKGIQILIDEVIDPLLGSGLLDRLDVFCLSNLNMARRAGSELNAFLDVGTAMLPSLIAHGAQSYSVRTVGSYLQPNVIKTRQGSRRLLTLLIGCSVDDDVDCEPVDIFVRSGGELRLSGAPRSLIGSDTQFYSIEKYHPEVRASDFREIIARFQNRYIRRTDQR